MSDRAEGMGRRALLLAPMLGAQAPAPESARIIAQLSLARDILCADCNNDVESEGVNRPARRSILAAGTLAAAREMLETTPGHAGGGVARAQIDRALEALESVDEAAAIAAIDSAIAALGAR